MNNQKTYRELKEFISLLSEDQLNQKVSIDRLDEESMMLVDMCISDEDFYIYGGDWEDCGTKELLKECHEDDFDEDELTLIYSKGTVFMGAAYLPKNVKHENEATPQ